MVRKSIFLFRLLTFASSIFCIKHFYIRNLFSSNCLLGLLNFIMQIIVLLFLKIFLFRFYTVTAPGDTIHVIGKFDDQGKCDIDHKNNFLIVNPDILMSGTRVIIIICLLKCCGIFFCTYENVCRGFYNV